VLKPKRRGRLNLNAPLCAPKLSLWISSTVNHQSAKKLKTSHPPYTIDLDTTLGGLERLL